MDRKSSSEEVLVLVWARSYFEVGVADGDCLCHFLSLNERKEVASDVETPCFYVFKEAGF